MAVYSVTDYDHLRAGFPANRVSEVHLTITTDREYHITIVSADGVRNNYFYNSDGSFREQRGGHANYLYTTYPSAYQSIANKAWDDFSSVSAYIA